MAAGFPPARPDGHHLINRTAGPAVYLEVGTRREDVDEVDYPDIDMAVQRQAAARCSSGRAASRTDRRA